MTTKNSSKAKDKKKAIRIDPDIYRDVESRAKEEERSIERTANRLLRLGLEKGHTK